MHAEPPNPCWDSTHLPRGEAATPVARRWLATRLDLAPDALGFVRTAHGRPMLQSPAGFDCNWSHSGERLAIALGQGLQVGIDIERERPRPRALELARRYFTPAEAAWLATRGERARSRDFLRLWCAREAVLKAHGRGLAFGLDRLAFEEGGDGQLHLARCDPALGTPGQWRLMPLLPAPGYLGMLAWRAAPAATARHTAPR